MTSPPGEGTLASVRRVPVPLVLILSIGTVAGVWWSGTKDMDFMTPQGGHVAMTDFSPGVTTPDAPGPKAVVPVDLSQDQSASLSPPPEFTLDLGDLASSPALSEYTEHEDKGAPYLIRLATELEARGEFQRALLCWERVLDSTTPTASERDTASSAVIRIKPTLPRWTVDPMAALRLSIQVGSTRPGSEAIDAAVQRLRNFLRSDSSDQINFALEVNSSSSPDAPDLGPIAISLSSFAADPDGFTLVRSIAPEGNDEETLFQALLAKTYDLVTNHLATLEESVPPPQRLPEQASEEAFLRNITRLHWRLFAQSLIPPNQDNPPYQELEDEN